MASPLFSSQTLTATSNRLFFRRSATAFPSSSTQENLPLISLSNSRVLSFSPLQNHSKSRIACISNSNVRNNVVIKSPQTAIPADDLIAGSTRIVTTIMAITFAAVKFLSCEALSLALQLKTPVLAATGPAFFAAMKNVPSASLNTPLTVVAAGMAKWLDIYSGVLLVRVLLSWFPNIPWDRQPLSAIRDLCDPYLNLFRNIIPPIFNTLDISPLLAFAVLGALGSILNSSRPSF